MSEETDKDAKIQQLAMVAGIAIMHDVRMVVREELERYMDKTAPMNYHSTMMCIRHELERVGLTNPTKPLTSDEMASWRKHLRECREKEASQ
jgi:hypothetical protein